MEQITSRQNETIKRYSRLLKSPAERREQGLYLCEGARLCCDAVESGVAVAACYVTEQAYGKYQRYCDVILEAAEQKVWISEHIAPLLSDTKNPQGVFCVCRLPAKERSLASVASNGCYLALETVQDPANLGTVLRTAEALGVSGVILSGGCDPFGPKVLRGSMGAVFRLPVFLCDDMAAAMQQLNGSGFQTLAAVVDPAAESVLSVDCTVPTVMVIGNEGNGLTAETIAACTHQVTIPMLGRAESLNASAASSILLWEMMRGRTGDETGGCQHG